MNSVQNTASTERKTIEYIHAIHKIADYTIWLTSLCAVLTLTIALTLQLDENSVYLLILLVCILCTLFFLSISTLYKYKEATQAHSLYTVGEVFKVQVDSESNKQRLFIHISNNIINEDCVLCYAYKNVSFKPGEKVRVFCYEDLNGNTSAIVDTAFDRVFFAGLKVGFTATPIVLVAYLLSSLALTLL